MSTNTELYQSIHQRLAFLYGEEHAPAIVRHIRRLIDTHIQLRDIAIAEKHWSQADVVLISYGDSIQAPAQPPLHSLKQFIDAHLRDSFNLVHILPFYPWSSDGGFSVTDFRAVQGDQRPANCARPNLVGG